MKSALIRIAALAALFSGLWIASTQQPDAGRARIEKLADDLYVIIDQLPPGEPRAGNVAVLTTPEGVVLVDDKFERDVPEILAKVRVITEKPIRYVFNTHHHADHSGGNAKLQGLAVEILAHQNARANMQKASQPGLPQITFEREAAAYLGGQEVRAHYFGRGHTNGDVVVFFASHRVIHTGDLFVSDGRPTIDYAAGGSALAWIRTLDEILKTDFDTVIPGHGPVMKRQDLVAWRNRFQIMIDRVSSLKKQGKTREEVSRMLQLDDIGWTGGKPECPRCKGMPSYLPRLYEELQP